MISKELLSRLVGFDTVSRGSNLVLIEFVASYLASFGVQSQLFEDRSGQKASLYARIGPSVGGGVVLSGHTDVVPVDGQAWSSDPFRLVEKDGRLFGRGASDMKGFIASVLAAVPVIVKAHLNRPIHLALSYDEEIGCLGVRPMLDRLVQQGVTPDFCIVGEPTGMQVATAHKGKLAATCRCHGHAAHSALATTGLNAIYLANDMIAAIRRLQEDVVVFGARDEGYSVPYTTLHVGKIVGGSVLNIVPEHCSFELEIRYLPGEDPTLLLKRLEATAGQLLAVQSDRFPKAAISIGIENEYPGLWTSDNSSLVTHLRSLTASNATTKVAFGTEAGLFQKAMQIPVVVCGPGSMDQGHRPDEYIEIDQLAASDRFLDRLISGLAA